MKLKASGWQVEHNEKENLILSDKAKSSLVGQQLYRCPLLRCPTMERQRGNPKAVYSYSFFLPN